MDVLYGIQAGTEIIIIRNSNIERPQKQKKKIFKKNYKL